MQALRLSKKKSEPVKTFLKRLGEPMATLEDTKDPYWCAAWNKGCAFLYRDGYLCRVRILDDDNQPLPPQEYEVVERMSRAEDQPDSRLPPLLWVQRDRCCPRCQGQSSLWRTAERRQLPQIGRAHV